MNYYFRKLKAAKDKLKQLQDLVSMVQHSPDTAQGLPENLMELAGSLDDGEFGGGTELSEGEIPNSQEERCVRVLHESIYCTLVPSYHMSCL